MRLTVLFILTTSILLFTSCSEAKKKMQQRKKENFQPFIINLTSNFSENENNMSFPIWFVDSIIAQRKIKSIIRYVYPPYDGNDADKQIPKEAKSYFFNLQGEVLNVNIDQYYEYVKVGSLTFEYLSEKDEYGYSSVIMKQAEQKENDDIESQFFLFDKEEYSNKFLVYKEQESGDYLFYMLNKKNWGALSVDSILRPTPDDIVVFGSPKCPHKTYQVENTVNEFNVTLNSYSKKEQFLLESTLESFPFHTKRSVQYDDLGVCKGFIDSTFNGEQYLTRRNSRFIFENGLPVKLIHESKSNNAEHGFVQMEEFVYEFTESKKDE